MFKALRNQKCEVFTERIVTYEGQSNADHYYKKININYPISFVHQKESWIISDSIPSATDE